MSVEFNCQKIQKLVLSAISARTGTSGDYVVLTDTASDTLDNFSIKGNTLLSHTPAMSNPAEILSVQSPFVVYAYNKNLLNGLCRVNLDLDSSFKVISSDYAVSFVIRVLPNKKYVISGNFDYLKNFKATYAVFDEYPTIGDAASGYGYVTSGSVIRTQSTAKFVLLRLDSLSDGDLMTKLMQFEEGEVPTAYTKSDYFYRYYTVKDVNDNAYCLDSVVYGDSYGTYNLYDQIQKSNIDYKWYIVKRTARITLSAAADEVWEADDYYTGLYRIYLPDAKNSSTGVDCGVCDRFRFSMRSTAVYNGYCCLKGKYFYLRLPGNDFPTLADVTSWLAENPVNVIYPLETPQSFELCEETATALEKIPLFYPNTNLETRQTVGSNPIIDVKNFILSEYVQQPCFLTDSDNELNLPITRADCVYFSDGSTLADRM